MSETEQPQPGVAVTLEPGLRRILAPNPSPMTHWGTNTYLVGTGAVTVIDPGPDIAAHREAILDALEPGEHIGHIAVTHPHLDHSALAPALAAATGAPISAFGQAEDGRSDVMTRLAAEGFSGGGEGLDHPFRPDRLLRNGDEVGPLTALHTPGHAAAHLSFTWQDAVFSGDIVMGWASTMVSPPDGDLAAFMRSAERLGAMGARVFYPGHGAPILDPAARCAWLTDHRKTREGAIRAAIGPNGATAASIARAVYTDAPPALLPAAERNVFAHLIDLTEQNLVRPEPHLAADATFFTV